jgi:hypothetical protein
MSWRSEELEEEGREEKKNIILLFRSKYLLNGLGNQKKLEEEENTNEKALKWKWKYFYVEEKAIMWREKENEEKREEKSLCERKYILKEKYQKMKAINEKAI